ncbi:MAG: hypothetical protein ACTTJC_05335 [Campylobacter sp.]
MNYDEFLLKLKEAGIDRDEFAELTKTNKLTMNGWATTRQGYNYKRVEEIKQ